MKPLTIKERMATFPADQLLALARQGLGVCLFCAAEEPAPLGARRAPCSHCHEPYLYHPDEILVANLGAHQ
jgi:hypothetical protein